MGINADYDGIEEEPWLVKDPGEKCLRITKAKESKSKKSNYDMAVLDLVIIGGADDGRMVRFHNVVFCPKDEPGAGLAAKFLKSIGEDVKGFFQPAKWVGRFIKGYVKVETYNGKRNNKIEWVDKWEGPIPRSKHSDDNLEEVPF